MVRAGVVRCLGLACMLGAANGAVAQTENVVAQVSQRVNARDCTGAVKLLKAGLDENSPGAALLAGTMYERGICLKKDWDSAAGHYIRAHELGERAAAFRLAAGYAAPMGGPDPAAALWWLGQSNAKTLQAPCEVPVSERVDPDRFVAVLQTWTASRIAGCNYVAGLLATVSGEAQFPSEPFLRREVGTLVLRFMPGLGSIDIWTTPTGGLLSVTPPEGNDPMRRATRHSGFETGVRELADRALARYPQPPGLDPAWSEYLSISFAPTR